MQYTKIFKLVKNENFQYNIFDIFLIFALNIDCGRGGSNGYTQSMFWNKNKKNRYTPTNAIFFYIKVGFKGVYFSWICFPDALHVCVIVLIETVDKSSIDGTVSFI